MIEVEIKTKISKPDLIKQKLKKIGGIYKLSLIHEDTYFNMPNGLRDFKKTDEALRLRKSIEFSKKDKTKSHKVNYFITYKGKKIDTSTKTRKEIELNIANLEKMREILTVIGFQEVFTVVKERDLFIIEHKNHQITALIDYLPLLKQFFMEIEYPCDSINNINVHREILFSFLSHLGIDRKESITKSYLELILEEVGVT